MQVRLLDLTAQYISLRREIRQAIDAVCDAQAFILGPTVEKFEKNLADYCGTKHAVGMSSGTDALLCALMALDIKPGDEVICPSFTFFATAGSIARVGAKPVFVDIDPATFNIDPSLIKSRITPRTRAIMPVHLFGQMADMDAIMNIARAHNLKVIEDAAQAIGAKQEARDGGTTPSGASRQNGKLACSIGDCGCLSFFPSKNLGGFGDGGAVTTNDDDLAYKLKLNRVHGTERTYYHKVVGGNFRLDALQAAVLDVKLKYLNDWHEARRKNAALYDKLFATSKVQTPTIDPSNYSIYNQYVVRLPNRDAVREKLTAAGVGNAVYYPLPLHLQECFAYLGLKPGDLPESERACHEVLALPIYPELTHEQIRYVAEQVLAAVG